MKTTGLIPSILFLCLLSGCFPSIGTIAVKPGETNIPHNLKPLVHLTVRIGFKLYRNQKTPFLQSRGILFESTDTGKRFVFMFERNMWVKGSKRAPYQIDGNATYTPLVITLPIGHYKIISIRLDGDNFKGMGDIDLNPLDLLVNVKSEDFNDLGTMVVVLKGTKKAKLSFQFITGVSMWIKSSEKEITMRPASQNEIDFAIKVYPLLEQFLDN